MNKTYIQKGTDVKKDILSVYKITNKHIPDIHLELKELFRRDWAEQQGDQEYIPSAAMFKAYEQDLEFVCMDTLAAAGTAIKTFLAYLQGAEFSLYSEYHNRGIRCRYVGYDNKAFYREAEDVVVFNIKVKVNNPLCYVVKPTTSTGGLSTVTLAGGGTGYAPGANVLTVVQSGGSGGTINCTANSSGVITTINNITTIGSGYAVANGKSVTGGTGANCTVNITAVGGLAISMAVNSATIVYFSDGTFTNVNASGDSFSKIFTEAGHFAIVCPQKL